MDLLSCSALPDRFRRRMAVALPSSLWNKAFVSLFARLLVATCAGTLAGALGVMQMFSIADARGYHYEEILSRSHIVLIVVFLAFLSSLGLGLVQTLLLAVAGDRRKIRIGFFAALCVGAVIIQWAESLSTLWTFATMLPVLAASFSSLLCVD